MLWTVVTTLALARATRLVTTDEITAGMRSAIVRRLPEGHLLAYGLHCRWCVSMWLALPSSPLLCIATGTSLRWALPLALAMSYVVGLAARLEAG